MDSQELARQATTIAYANRIIGKNSPLPPIRYSASFDYIAVADSVPIPKSPGLSEHQNCWTGLFLAFDRAWWEQE